MTDSRDQPDIETLGYKPEVKITQISVNCKGCGWSGRIIECDCDADFPKEHIDDGRLRCPKCSEVVQEVPSTSTSPATLGFNSHVIKPETRVNKAEDASQHPDLCNCKDCMPKSIEKQFEQPNKNLMIITEIEGLISQVNEKLGKLEEPWKYNYKTLVKSQAIEEIDIFQKTTLFELRKAFE